MLDRDEKAAEALGWKITCLRVKEDQAGLISWIAIRIIVVVTIAIFVRLYPSAVDSTNSGFTHTDDWWLLSFGIIFVICLIVFLIAHYLAWFYDRELKASGADFEGAPTRSRVK